MKPNAALEQSLSDRRMRRSRIAAHIVDDNILIQKLLMNALTSVCTVSQSESGKSVRQDYAYAAPDIIFLDIGLPDVRGEDVLEEIMKVDPEAYVVMLSGQGDRETILRCAKRGAKGFIGKPFTRQKLLNYINSSPHVRRKCSELAG